jgi:hypothetical protein
MKTFPDKQPSDLLDYDFNYSEWLKDDDVLTNAIVSIEDLNSTYKLTMKTKGISLENILNGSVSGEYELEGGPTLKAIISFFVVTDKYVKVWIEDGDDGERYKITCTAETHIGRIKESEALIKIKER